MKTRNRWFIFWGFIIVLVTGGGVVAATGNLPEFRIPFEWLVPKEKQQTKQVQTLPKIDALNLEQNPPATLLSQAETIRSQMTTVFGTPLSQLLQDGQLEQAMSDFQPTSTVVLNQLRAELAVLNTNSDLKFIKTIIKEAGIYRDQEQTTQEITLVSVFAADSDQYLLLTTKLSMRNQRLVGLTASQDKATTYPIALAKDDAFIASQSQFASLLTAFADKYTNRERYQGLTGKAAVQPDNPNVQSYVNGMPYGDKSTLAAIFVASEGDLSRMTITGYALTNTPTDGLVHYQVKIPRLNQTPLVVTIDYNRLTEQIKSFHQ